MPADTRPDFKPDFIVAGATRCGTTSLHEALAQHRAVCAARKKEIKFFYSDALYQKGLDFYAGHFAHRLEGQRCGEVCPLYFDKGFILSKDGPAWRPEDDCAARIHRAYPHVPIIFSLRDPIKRAHSIFWKNKWQGREQACTFEQAVEEELAGTRQPELTPFCFVWRNHYKIHIQRWLELFPQAQIHIMIFEEWTKNPQIAADMFERVLSLPPDTGWGAHCFVKSNEGRRLAHPALKQLSALGDKIPVVRSVTRRFLTQPGYPPIAPDIYATLCKVFAEDVTYLETLLGRRIDVWMKGV